MGGLLTLVVASFTACGGGDDDDVPGPGAAGSGGDVSTSGSGGTTPTGGKSPGVGGDGGAGLGGAGGEGLGGAGGEPTVTVDGYTVIAIDNEIGAGALLAWPEENRLVVTSDKKIRLFDVDDSGFHLSETIEPAEVVEGATEFWGLAKYGNGLVVKAHDEDSKQLHLVEVHLGEEPKVLLSLPEDESVMGLVGDPAVGLAFATAEGISFAATDAATATLLASGNRYVPLGLESDRVLVGVRERDGQPKSDEGAGGAGGAAGGAGGSDGGDSYGLPGHVLWMDFDGNTLADHEVKGSPGVASKVDAGWLIAQTSSFWGSGEAGIELLDDSGIKLLTTVPVRSRNDGTDGAFDLARDGDQLLVANCEAGLQGGTFSTESIDLTHIAGPWDNGKCSPTALEQVGDYLVVGGPEAPLVLLRRKE